MQYLSSGTLIAWFALIQHFNLDIPTSRQGR